MNEIKNITCGDLKNEEMKEFLTFIQTSLEKDATFRGIVKNVKAALNNNHLGVRTYVPTLDAKVLCEGQDLFATMGEMAKEMSLTNDTTNQRTKVKVGLPRGCGGIEESNVWMVELKSRFTARSIAKGYSNNDIVVVGIEVMGHDINVYVAHKDEAEAYKDEVGNEDGQGFNFLPITSKFLTRLMGVAA